MYPPETEKCAERRVMWSVYFLCKFHKSDLTLAPGTRPVISHNPIWLFVFRIVAVSYNFLIENVAENENIEREKKVPLLHTDNRMIIRVDCIGTSWVVVNSLRVGNEAFLNMNGYANADFVVGEDVMQLSLIARIVNACV